MHRQVKSFAQSRDEFGCGCWPQEPGHILDCKNVSTGCNNFFGNRKVIVEGVELFVRVKQVGGIAESDFGHCRLGFKHGLDGRQHLINIVKCVKNSKNIDARFCRFKNESARDFNRVWRVANRVSSAQQHLNAKVWHQRAQLSQALPRVFA